MDFFALFCVSFFVLGSLSAQNKKGVSPESVILNIPEDVRDVFVLLDLIEKDSGYNLLYTNAITKLTSKEAFLTKGKYTLRDVLGILRKEFSIVYEIQDTNILLKIEDISNDFITVYGIIAASDGVPLYGANVVVKGSVKGVQSDFDGKYNITVPNAAILEFSYIGMETRQIYVDGTKEINVMLQSNPEILAEVMVTGYGTQIRKNVTTAITKVKAEDFNVGMVNTPLDLITGKVPGLTVTNVANNPNSGLSIQLRGVTSIQGGNSPLIVVDGFPGGHLDLIQPNDVASFDVLKDGAAAAVYGTRANNGVILITTKQGIKGNTTFEYMSNFSTDFEDKRAKPDFLKAEDWRTLIAEGKLNVTSDHGASTDIWDELINKNNLSQYHTFAVNGGGDTNLYRVSLYYSKAEGIALENEREELGGRINFTQNAFEEKLQFKAGIALNHNVANLLGGGDFGSVINWNPTNPIYAEQSDTNPGEYGYYEMYNGYNPIARYNARIYERKQLTLAAQARLSYEVLPKLTLTGFGAYQNNNFEDRQYRTTRDWTQYQEGSVYNGTGYAFKNNNLDYTKLLETIINYNYVTPNHVFDVIAGYSYQYGTTEYFSASNSGFTSDATQDWNIGADNSFSDATLYSHKEDNTLIGFFSRLNYGLKDRYFIQASWRHEGSSRFGANNKWGDFPSISGAWVLSDESFMDKLTIISYLKLRMGYGITGNQDISNYQSIASLTTGYSYPVYYEGIDELEYYTTYGPSKNVNPDLKWETKQEFDLGVDFGFLNNKLTGTADVFYRNTKDVLYNYAAQLPSGVASSILANVGNIKNKGVELNITYKAISTPNFNWEIKFNGSYQDNEVASLSNDLYYLSEFETGNIGNPGSLGNAFIVKEGHPIGGYYGKQFAGFTDDGKWLFYKADGTIGTSSEVSDDDNQVIGNGMPRYYASLYNTFRYKNFDLSIFLRGKFDYDILNTVDMFYGNPYVIGTSNVLRSALTRHNTINEAPIYSSYYLEKGDFVKLDNVSLGYNFKLNESSFMSHLRMFVSVRNLYTITGYTGRDPEVDDTGLTPGMDDRSYYPRTKTVTIGLKAMF